MAAFVSLQLFIIVIVLGLGALVLLVVPLSSQRVSSHSCDILAELVPDPNRPERSDIFIQREVE